LEASSQEISNKKKEKSRVIFKSKFDFIFMFIEL
jgi:hypothetical protein